MPYIKRNAANEIELVSAVKTEETAEFIAKSDQELQTFLEGLTPQGTSAIEQTDTEIARVFEDLVDVLIAKGVIQFTDLPEPAQRKLIKRQTLRKQATNLEFDADHDDDTIQIG